MRLSILAIVYTAVIATLAQDCSAPAMTALGDSGDSSRIHEAREVLQAHARCQNKDASAPTVELFRAAKFLRWSATSVLGTPPLPAASPVPLTPPSMTLAVAAVAKAVATTPITIYGDVSLRLAGPVVFMIGVVSSMTAILTGFK